MKIVIPVGQHGKARLTNGSYRIAASVDAPNVSNYAGFEKLSGGDYEAEYYIVFENTYKRKY